MRRTGLVIDSLFRRHLEGLPHHPEHPKRLEAVQAALDAEPWRGDLVAVPARPATPEELLRVHGERHVNAMARHAGKAFASIDADTWGSAHSHDAALAAAGSAAEAVAQVTSGALDNAFAVVRPPGHHAEPDTAMGFCWFNNAAVAAAAARAAGLDRVAIVDFDVHHGNGTEAAFSDDPSVLFVSSHQWPLYPGTGRLDDVGVGAGRGYTVNLPVPRGTGDGDMALVYREVVGPVLDAYKPQLIIVSAGYDAHRDDPLGGLRLTRAGFDAMLGVLLDAAERHAGGRIVMLLEGGYNPPALGRAVTSHVGMLLGAARADAAPPGDPTDAGAARVAEMRKVQRAFHAGLSS